MKMKYSIILLGFVLILFTNSASSGMGCCREDVLGNTCAYVEQSACRTQNLFAPSFCFVTTFCQAGCCYDDSTGIYEPGVLNSDCRKTWVADPNCNIPGAEKGCCVLGNAKFFETRKKCEIDTVNLAIGENNNPDWRTISREECARLDLGNEGACVNEDGSCFHTDSNTCSNRSGSFSQGHLCSDPSLNTSCKMTSNTRCVPGKDGVYFVDSCGNIANVYDFTKASNSSYWSFMVNKSQSCGATDSRANANSGTCGNCDRLSGSYCSIADSGIAPSLGNNYCKENVCTTNDGRVYKHDESWCEYDGAAGNGSDVPGSKHWRYYCDKGIIKNDGCSDKRARICIQTSKLSPDENHNMTYAECKPNGADDCAGFNVGEGAERLANLAKCEENSFCKIYSVRVDSEFRLDFCVPKFPIGYDFKDESSYDAAKEKCGLATATCVRKDTEETFGGGDTSNGQCSGPEFPKQMNEVCRMMGDCGAEVNILGDYSKHFSVTSGVNTLEESWINNTLSPLALFNNDTVFFFSGNEPLNITYIIAKDWGLVQNNYWYYNKNFHDGEVFSMVPHGHCAENRIGGFGCGEYVVDYYTLTFADGETEDINASTLDPLLNNTREFFYDTEGSVSDGPGDFHRTSVTRIEFKCKPWKPIPGGDRCEECNGNPLKLCTKYRCESLGQTCAILNVGTGRELCAVNSTSPNAPVLDVLRNDSLYRYSEINNTGYRILDLGQNCFEANSNIFLGIKTDIPSVCRYSSNNTGYENMSDFDDNFYSSEHSQEFLLEDPSHGISGGPSVTANQSQYIRCQNMNGISNPTSYRIDYCIREGPDITFRGDLSFEPLSESMISFNASSINFRLYTKELSTCRASKNDTSYDDMEYALVCESGLGSPEPRGYLCFGNFSTPDSRNNYYIKCKDQPWLDDLNRSSERNEKGAIYTVLKPENIITIDSIEPNSEIINNTDFVTIELKVHTSGGDGAHTCSWTTSPERSIFNQMWITGVAGEHRQPGINIPVGENRIYVQCIDEVFDRAIDSTAFTVTKDDKVPNIARIWTIGETLHFITTEEAECRYSDKKCNFIWNGSEMAGTGLNHDFGVKKGKNYYIKCMDEYGNLPGSCNIAIRPV